MVGQIYPTNRHSETEPVIALLVPVQNAMDEYQAQTGEEVTRKAFISLLKEQGVHVFNNLEDFDKFKNNLKKLEKEVKQNKVAQKRNISEERRNQLKEHASAIRAKIGASISQND